MRSDSLNAKPSKLAHCQQRPQIQILTHTAHSAKIVVLGLPNTKHRRRSLKTDLWAMCLFIIQRHFLGTSLPKHLPRIAAAIRGKAAELIVWPDRKALTQNCQFVAMTQR